MVRMYGSSNTYRELDTETIKMQWLDSIPKSLFVVVVVFFGLRKAYGLSIPLLGPICLLLLF